MSNQSNSKSNNTRNSQPTNSQQIIYEVHSPITEIKAGEQEAIKEKAALQASKYMSKDNNLRRQLLTMAINNLEQFKQSIAELPNDKPYVDSRKGAQPNKWHILGAAISFCRMSLEITAMSPDWENCITDLSSLNDKSLTTRELNVRRFARSLLQCTRDIVTTLIELSKAAFIPVEGNYLMGRSWDAKHLGARLLTYAIELPSMAVPIAEIYFSSTGQEAIACRTAYAKVLRRMQDYAVEETRQLEAEIKGLNVKRAQELKIFKALKDRTPHIVHALQQQGSRINTSTGELGWISLNFSDRVTVEAATEPMDISIVGTAHGLKTEKKCSIAGFNPDLYAKYLVRIFALLSKVFVMRNLNDARFSGDLTYPENTKHADEHRRINCGQHYEVNPGCGDLEGAYNTGTYLNISRIAWVQLSRAQSADTAQEPDENETRDTPMASEVETTN